MSGGFDVVNAGTRAGDEVAQVYVGFPADAGEPPRQLRCFERADGLNPGDVRRVRCDLRPRDTQVWDTALGRWTRVDGEHFVHVGKEKCCFGDYHSSPSSSIITIIIIIHHHSHHVIWSSTCF